MLCIGVDNVSMSSYFEFSFSVLRFKFFVNAIFDIFRNLETLTNLKFQIHNVIGFELVF